MNFSAWLLVVSAFLHHAGAELQQCSSRQPLVPDYSAVLSTANDSAFSELPGFTRSVYKPDYALVTAESRVFAPLPAWKDTLTAHVISRASGAHFSMYFAKMKDGGHLDCDHEHHLKPNVDVHRFILVLAGALRLPVTPTTGAGALPTTLPANHYLYVPPGFSGTIVADGDTELVVYERRHTKRVLTNAAKPVGGGALMFGNVEDSPELDTGAEIFTLRKLLPMGPEFTFNIHVMDFQPGEHLIVKEVHYNQHGLVLLQGKGIYRLADDWYPVTAGDAIWMAPYVPQWFAALGDRPARYILYKDTSLDPLDDPM